jgi:hypothetical protein
MWISMVWLLMKLLAVAWKSSSSSGWKIVPSCV